MYTCTHTTHTTYICIYVYMCPYGLSFIASVKSGIFQVNLSGVKMGNSSSNSKNTSGSIERRNTKKDKDKSSKQKPLPPPTTVVKPYNDLEYKEEPQVKEGILKADKAV